MCTLDNPEILRKIGEKEREKIKKFTLDNYLKKLTANF